MRNDFKKVSMPMKNRFLLSFLFSVSSFIYTSDEKTGPLLVNARTDQNVYEDNMERHKIIGGLLGGASGLLSTIGIVIALAANHAHPAGVIFLAIGNTLAQTGTGWLLGYGIKRCTTGTDTQTYKPRVFASADQKDNDDAYILLE
jgi:hypothetical protein